MILKLLRHLYWKWKNREMHYIPYYGGFYARRTIFYPLLMTCSYVTVELAESSVLEIDHIYISSALMIMNPRHYCLTF